MAGPFDISNFEKATGGSGLNDPEVLRRANRAARVAKFGEASVAQMEAAGKRFGSTTTGGTARTAATAAPAPAAPASPAPTSRFARLRQLANPNISFGNVGRLAKSIAKPGLALAPVVGGLVAATDTPEEISDFRRSVGGSDTTFGRGASRVGRFLTATGDAASFGLAGRLGNFLTGRGFVRSEESPVSPVAGTEQPVAEAAPAVAQQAPAPVGAAPGVRRITDPDRLAVADESLGGDFVAQAPGTGFIRNEATGDTREFVGGGGTRTGPSPGFTRGGRVAIDASGFRARRDIERTALIENRAQLANAAFVKALSDARKPEKTDIIPSLVPGGKSEVIQVRDGKARSLPVTAQLPPGYTPAIAAAEARATIAAQGNTKKVRDQVNARLAEFGLPPLTPPTK